MSHSVHQLEAALEHLWLLRRDGEDFLPGECSTCAFILNFAKDRGNTPPKEPNHFARRLAEIRDSVDGKD